MSTLDPQDRPSNPQAPAGSPSLDSARRRRLVKLGAGAVPVALTLPSRPVFAAGQCNTTSAWGSAILHNGVGSVQARASHALVADPVWSLGQLLKNTAASGVGGGKAPWDKIYSSRYLGQSPGKGTPAEYAQATLKVRDIFPSGIMNYAGTPDTVFGYLRARPNTKDFVTCLLVARLNALYAGGGASRCLTNQNQDDVLALMAGGSYQPPNGTGGAWTSLQITEYLIQNGIVTR